MHVGLLSKWLGSCGVETKASLASPDAALFELFGVQPVAGVSVSPRTALQCTPVKCAVETISQAVAQLSLPVYAVGDEGSKEIDTKHPVHRLLNGEANPWSPAPRLREQLTRDALLYGNGYAAIVFVEGRPVELIRLHPECVSVTVDLATGEPVYRVSGDPNVLSSKGASASFICRRPRSTA